MSTNNTINIFIASAAELAEERDACLITISKVNNSYPQLHLKGIEWEYAVVPGNFPGYDTIQDGINPKLMESDLVVFFFYSKIGDNTRTEFELALKEKKKILVYFKTGLSPSEATYRDLLEFQSLLKKKQVLYREYKDLVDFRLLLTDHIHLFLSERFPPKMPEDTAYANEFTNIKTNLEGSLKINKGVIGAMLVAICVFLILGYQNPVDFKLISIFGLIICVVVISLQANNIHNVKRRIEVHGIYVTNYLHGPPPPKDIIIENIITNSRISLFWS